MGVWIISGVLQEKKIHGIPVRSNEIDFQFPIINLQ